MFTPADVAETQLGIHEDTGHNDGVPADRYMRGDELAWCAGFVLWCYDISDVEDLATSTKDYYKMRNVQKFEDEMKRRGLWFGRRFHQYVRRDDVIFYRDRGSSDKGAGRHVGIVTSEGCRNLFSKIDSVEGNLGDAVKRATHKIDDDRITGFARSVAHPPFDFRATAPMAGRTWRLD